MEWAGSEEIVSSKLGLQSYWEEHYKKELDNFEKFGDEGDVWFGVSAERRIVSYLVESKADREKPILDLGCGNGSVLRSLRKKGFKRLVGVDYCEAAVQLADRVAQEDSEEDDGIGELPRIRFEQLDVLNPTEEVLDCEFDVVLDKGTWDAISLSDDRESRLVAYKKTLAKSLAPGGKFVIVSCNYTEEELKSTFSDDDLAFLVSLPAATVISFGGKQGSTSTGAVFTKHS